MSSASTASMGTKTDRCEPENAGQPPRLLISAKTATDLHLIGGVSDGLPNSEMSMADIPCDLCGQPGTHQHLNAPQSIDSALCDLCCDRNCEHYSKAYWRRRCRS